MTCGEQDPAQLRAVKLTNCKLKNYELSLIVLRFCEIFKLELLKQTPQNLWKLLEPEVTHISSPSLQHTRRDAGKNKCQKQM